MNPFAKPILRFFGLWMLIGIGLFYLLVLLAVGDGGVSDTGGALILQCLALLPIFWILWLQGTGKFSVGQLFNKGIAPFHWYELVLIWVGVIVLSYGIEGLTNVVVAIWAPGYIEDMLQESFLPAGQAPFLNVLAVILAVLLGPVMEEFVFRGLILQRWSIKFGMTKAIVFSSLLFGLLHFESWLSASFFGIVMCLLFLRTQNLWVPIFLHVANNALAVISNIWQQHREEEIVIEMLQDQILYYVLALILTPLAIFTMRKYWPPTNLDIPYVQNQNHT